MVTIQEMYGMVRDFMESLPCGIPVRIEAGENSLGADNVSLSLTDDGWAVTVARFWNGNRENPPEVEEVFIGTVGGNETQAAINMFITTVVENRLNMFWDKKADEAMAKALENEHE